MKALPGFPSGWELHCTASLHCTQTLRFAFSSSLSPEPWRRQVFGFMKQNTFKHWEHLKDHRQRGFWSGDHPSLSMAHQEEGTGWQWGSHRARAPFGAAGNPWIPWQLGWGWRQAGLLSGCSAQHSLTWLWKLSWMQPKPSTHTCFVVPACTIKIVLV